MPERRQVGSISRNLLLTRERISQGTFRLRHILAEDGCKESQVALAKCLLTNPATNSEEREINAQLAVYWLLQAANKGQEEAVTLLQECVNAGIGINAANYLAIEECLNFSEEEKISRRVAFSIFRAIMSDTEDVIPEKIFRERTERILQGEKEFPSPKLTDELIFQHEHLSLKKTNESSFGNQGHVSFSEVVNSVQSCLEGNVPLVSLKQVTQYDEYKKVFSAKYVSVLCSILLSSLEDFIQKFASFVILFTIILLCTFLEFIASVSTPGSEFNLLMSKCRIFFATLLSLTAMISTTSFVICISFGGDNMKKWLHLIKFFESNIKSDEIKKKYLMKTAFPLLSFFVVSLMFITVFPLNEVLSGFNDLVVLSFVLMLFVDRTITHKRYYVNISLFLNALTCLYKSNMLHKLSYAAFSYFDIDLVYEISRKIEIHLNLISCLSLPFVLPYLYTKMALGNEWKGWHLVLLPHMMCVIWMNLAFFHLADVSETHLLFSVLSWLVILILSKYTGIFLALNFYIFIKLTLISGVAVFQLFLIVPTTMVLYLLSKFCVKKFKISHENKYHSMFACMLVLLLTYQAVKPQSSLTDAESSSVLPWDKYQAHCYHRAWYRTNTADVQISCLPLKGRKISAEGTVSTVDVMDIHNSMKLFADILPNPLHNWFLMAFGKKFVTCDSENITPFEKEHCSFYESLNISEYHLRNWDVYSYRIILEVSSRTSPEIAVMVNDICSSFVRNLKEGDSLKVIGILESNIGGTLPKFSLEKAHCSSCYSDLNCDTTVTLPQPNYSDSLKNIIWFYFSPFMQYVTKN